MSLIVTLGGSEVDRYDASRSANNAGHDDHDLDSQPPSNIFSQPPNDHAVRHSNASIVTYQSQAKVTTWLQYNKDCTPAPCVRYAHADDDTTHEFLDITPEGIPAAAVDPVSAAEAEIECEKQLSSADSTEHTPQTTGSSNEEQPSDSAATSVTPWGTPEVLPILPIQGIGPDRPESPSGISEFSLNPSRYTPSLCSFRDQTSQRINPKVARLKNGINRLDSPTFSRPRSSFGRPSSVAMGKRPVGRYGIGDHIGEFPPVAAHLASYEPRRSIASQGSFTPARPDSKIFMFYVPTRNRSIKLNASLPPNAEAYESLTASDPRNLQAYSTPHREITILVCEPPMSSTATSHLRAISGDESPEKDTSSTTKTEILGDEVLECAVPVLVPQSGTYLKIGNRASLPTAFCAVAPSILGRYGEATYFASLTMESDPTDHYVPLSDACPLLVCSLALKQRLCAQDIDREDPKVRTILKQHAIAVELVSKSDQRVLWHLVTHDESREFARKASEEPFPHTIHWKGVGQSYSEVDLTLKDFLRWLKEKEQAHIKLCQRELKGLAARSEPEQVQWANKRDKCDDRAIAPGGALPSPHEPAAVWLNIYRIMRGRGMDEKQLDREDFMALMAKSPDERRIYLDTLAIKCRARTIDNADLDRRQRRHESIRHTQTTSSRPRIRIRSPSYSWEAQDQCLDLPDLKKHSHRGHFGRLWYSVIDSDKRGRSCSGDSDWDTPLGKFPLNRKDKLPPPLLSDIELPRNYVPPDRRSDGDDELPPSRAVGLLGDKRASCAIERRGSQISRFSRDSTKSERLGRTRLGRFRRGLKRCLPPCCCG